jgi:hypothetical protein
MSRFFTRLGIFLLLVFIPLWIFGQDIVSVTVKENQSLRDISQQYLGNPDLWIDILQANGLNNALEVKPGMVLKIPVKAISQANQALIHASDMIEKANKNGAKIFALAWIDSAVSLKDKAIEARLAGKWDDCSKIAGDSYNVAKKAFDKCLKSKETTAQATLHYRYGTVQNRKPVDTSWLETVIGSLLIEGEKVRTLSRSNAEILFRDENRLRLEENSLATIQEMKMNILENKTKSKVSLVSGDFYALLGGKKSQDGFQVDLPGIETEVKSARFRVGKDEKAARFANYEGELGIKAAGSKVVLRENQGSVVETNKRPTPPKNLLPQVKLISPEDGGEFFNKEFALKWETVPGAAQYWLEIALDKNFVKTVISKKLNEADWKGLAEIGDGGYYWRVSAIDDLNLPAPSSQPRLFSLVKDDTPPYLMIKDLREAEIFYRDSVHIFGETEKGARVKLNEEELETDSSGAFSLVYNLSEGENRLLFIASDKAGNITRLERSVSYFPGGKADIVFDSKMTRVAPNSFLTNNSIFTLKGKTQPKSSLEIKSSDNRYHSQCYTDKEGNFQFNILLNEDSSDFNIVCVSASGSVSGETISIIVDNEPPIINLAEEIPQYISSKNYEVRGRIQGAKALSINGKPVNIEDGLFSKEIDLQEGGNTILLIASDEAGNAVSIKKGIFSDFTPPKFLKFQCSPMKTLGGEPILLTIFAQDECGLVRSSEFEIAVGTFNYTGLAQLSPEGDRYFCSIFIPQGFSGSVNLKSVKLGDNVGNAKIYEF